MVVYFHGSIVYRVAGSGAGGDNLCSLQELRVLCTCREGPAPQNKHHSCQCDTTTTLLLLCTDV